MYAVLDVSLQKDAGWRTVKNALGAQVAVMALINNKIEAVKGKNFVISYRALFAKFCIFLEHSGNSEIRIYICSTRLEHSDEKEAGFLDAKKSLKCFVHLQRKR